jgi:hypothetical protein
VVTEAITADESLTERQRQVLLEIYAAFQSENQAAAAPAAADPGAESTDHGAESTDHGAESTDHQPTRAATTTVGARQKKDQS